MEIKEMNLKQKLLNIQTELKAPKGQYNTYGKYHYRSCEDILEAIKPLCKKYNVTLVINDEIKQVGDRYYIKAIAQLVDVESDKLIEGVAYARESATKKGMDESQITGTASSYARKYALNGLFNIDDTKDADTDEHKQQLSTSDVQPVTPTQIKQLKELGAEVVVPLLKNYNVSKTKDLTMLQASELIKGVQNG